MWTSSAIRRFRPPWLTGLLVGALAVGDSIGGTGSVNQTLNATLQPIGKLSVPASLNLTASVTQFAPFSGTLAVSYRARTTPTGSGTITVRVTSDFLPAGGPSAAAAALSYTCGSASLGTPCSGTQTASTTVQTPVLTLPASACTGGGGTCSAANPASLNLSLTLTDNPGYATGSYSAQLTFTISAT
ncbi:MAG: hypothetical protein LAQ69_40400 [Acidobacteriia bacterium]|nr:hypothetical protein [Terriglobia bacterium]